MRLLFKLVMSSMPYLPGDYSRYVCDRFSNSRIVGAYSACAGIMAIPTPEGSLATSVLYDQYPSSTHLGVKPPSHRHPNFASLERVHTSAGPPAGGPGIWSAQSGLEKM